MKGNEQVKTGLQEAINLEYSLCLQYQLDQANVDRLGLKIEDGLGKLHEQCECFGKELVSALYFLEGQPAIAPSPAKSHTTVSDILNDAKAAEVAILVVYARLCKEALAADDLELFHRYQHLTKWHRQGGNGNKGHMSWLQKQLWQLAEFQEKEYEETKV